jgi:hypothetical protein
MGLAIRFDTVEGLAREILAHGAMPLGFSLASWYTSSFRCNVCKVKFAWSIRTPNAKPRRRGRGCKSTGVERGGCMTLLVLCLFLLYRTRRIKLKITIDL